MGLPKRIPDFVFRCDYLPWEALEARSDIEAWEGFGPDPNSHQGRRRLRMAVWKKEDLSMTTHIHNARIMAAHIHHLGPKAFALPGIKCDTVAETLSGLVEELDAITDAAAAVMSEIDDMNGGIDSDVVERLRSLIKKD